MKKSPTFCEPDRKHHIVGTAGRICNKTASQAEADSCSVLCCGRGYDTHEIVQKSKCFCQFYWCCKVRCKKCKKHFEITR
ncbi:Protein Wnt-2 [Exaiptasia diaphana]|nr:Protein Wnt-2 [Exaiptasia diaphana]